jgi:pyrroline-5-carboxylate reductase
LKFSKELRSLLLMQKAPLVIAGCGNMGEAVAASLYSRQFPIFRVDPKFEGDTSSERARCLSQATLHRAAGVLLAMKPQQLASFEADWHRVDASFQGTPIISILAGVSLSHLEKVFPGHSIIRVMPNLPLTFKEGAAVYCCSGGTTSDQRSLLTDIFTEICPVLIEVESENEVDIATALAGSGPAFFLLCAQAMTEAATELGLAAETATTLVLQTLRGAGIWAQQSHAPMTELIARVSSKGGTTEAGIQCFKQRGGEEILRAVIRAASERSKELGRDR